MTRHTQGKGRDANTYLTLNVSPLRALGGVFLDPGYPTWHCMAEAIEKEVPPKSLTP
jgi:hypothetical protein